MSDEPEKLPLRIGPSHIYEDGESVAVGGVIVFLISMGLTSKCFNTGHDVWGYICLVVGLGLTWAIFRAVLRNS
jgi:hypothetical protein